MQLNRLVPAAVAVWIWYVVFDMFLIGPIMGSAMASVPGAVAEPSTMWIILGDLAAALILTAMYDRVRGAFPSGVTGGATYGLYAGLLVNFPTWLWGAVYFSWPYGAAWRTTITLIVLGIIGGALIGLVYQKLGSSK
jgi:hypothetical protein